jgi:hypothetical protein
VQSFLCEGDEEEEEMDATRFSEDRNAMSEVNITLAKTGAVYIDT